jgi:hypothetical protein
MKTWKLELLAAAVSMAMAATAAAQTSSSTTTSQTGTSAMPGNSAMHNEIPAECAKLTGLAKSDCVRQHNPSSVKSQAGSNGNANTGRANSDVRRSTPGLPPNDKSGNGSSASGAAAGPGSADTGSTGASAGAASANGGSAGSTGGGNGK